MRDDWVCSEEGVGCGWAEVGGGIYHKKTGLPNKKAIKQVVDIGKFVYRLTRHQRLMQFVQNSQEESI